MKYLKFLATGIFFGIVMTKSEAISWYRIQEMFRFDSFHMYGIIGSALVTGVIFIQIIKRMEMNTIEGNKISISDKKMSIVRYLAGGTIFGLGWALAGACPGPMFTLIGTGYSVVLVLIASAIFGTFTYGLVRNKLPH